MKRLLSSLALSLSLAFSPTQAATDKNCEAILNGAEIAFSELFPVGSTTQIIGSWCFRSYTLGDITRYAGVNAQSSGNLQAGAYVMGPPFGNQPAFVGSSAQVLALINDLTGGGNTQEALCEMSDSLSSEIKTIQNGNLLTLTTEGKCIKIPATPPCTPFAGADENGTPTGTGISMLSTTEVIEFNFAGINIPNLPGFPNPLDPIVNSFANSTCFENVHEKTAAFDTVTDICFDVSDQIGDIPGISDTVTLAISANSSSVIVDDCSTTGAVNIIDLATNEESQ